MLVSPATGCASPLLSSRAPGSSAISSSEIARDYGDRRLNSVSQVTKALDNSFKFFLRDVNI